MKQKYYVVLNAQKHRLMIESLNQLRNKLIADGKYTDAVNEVLLKIIEAKEIQSNLQRGSSIGKVFYDKKNGLWYELQGDYYFPCLKLPEEEQQPIGVWGQPHLRYIKQNRKVFYLNLLTSGRLNGYLAELDKQAEVMFSRLVKQMAKREGVTEQQKKPVE